MERGRTMYFAFERAKLEAYILDIFLVDLYVQ